jgi:phosphatidylserine/phosphatidylglycerophosphate/cardiolipin synthase-like enzyme
VDPTSGDGDRLTLADGSPIWEDLTIARGEMSPHQIRAVREHLTLSHDQRIEVSRTSLNDSLPPELALGGEAAISLFTGLRQAGVAVEVSPGKTYADYTFEVDTHPAIDFLDQQLVAKLALERAAEEASQRTDVRLVVGLPPHIRPDVLDEPEVTRLGPRLRSMLFDADRTVRIANPYFDTSESVISDLASLPSRGIDTRILTREYGSNPTTREALEAVVAAADPAALSNLAVRDLYARDVDTGDHAYAIHAKAVISDNRRCYIGSANLMQTGLSANFELGVLLEGPMVGQVIEVFDEAFAAAEPVEIEAGRAP